MSTSTSSPRRASTVALMLGALIAMPGADANEPTATDREFIEMQTSLNAMMVAVVDWAAHEVWEAGYAETMTGRNWLTAKQYATQLLAAGTLVSLGGTGPADMTWVSNEEWQRCLVGTCEGCHEIFKPSIPTEGIMHVPHHEYGDPLVVE